MPGHLADTGKKQRPPKKKDEAPKDSDDLMTVRCGALVGSYIISEKMVLCDGKKMTPAKFEEKSGVKNNDSVNFSIRIGEMTTWIARRNLRSSWRQSRRGQGSSAV